MRRARQSIEDVFTPHPGPQTAAHECTAHVLGYGGSAGGGKTGLGIGKALTRHRRSIMLRRQFKDHAETEDFLDSLKGVNYNKNKHFAVTPDQRKLSLGHLQHERELKNWRGRGHDLIIIDEAAEWPEFFVRFLMGWNRTTIPDQHCQTLLTFNPPTTPQSPGRWVIDFFAAWLDPKHPKPAKDGELRWYAMLDGEEVEVESGEPFEHKNERGETELIEPLSRTFIRARLEDNPSLAETGYRARLQAMPEPLRSQLLYGDFAKGAEDHEWQVIPTLWVMAAQDRWRERQGEDHGPQTHLGLDIARGGDNNSVIAPRRGNWVDELIKAPGKKTPDEKAGADWVARHVENDEAVIQADVVGVGGPVVGRLSGQSAKVVSLDGSKPTKQRSKNGLFGFFNLRAQWHWRMRELLDPENGHEIALPPDRDLLVDLCAPRYEVRSGKIKVEEKKEIKKRIGRSPDDGDAVVYAFAQTARNTLLVGPVSSEGESTWDIS